MYSNSYSYVIDKYCIISSIQYMKQLSKRHKIVTNMPYILLTYLIACDILHEYVEHIIEHSESLI